MPSELISQFAGVMPRLSPELLPEGYAQTATNCLIERGILEASKAPLATGIAVSSNTKTIHWFNRDANSGLGYWFQWPDVVSVIRGQIADDSYLRTYIFGGGAPRYTTSNIATSSPPYPSVVHDLGLPIPSSPTAAGLIGEPIAGAVKISTSYVMTYVSDIGEESAPSYASDIVDRWDGGGAVELTGLSIAVGNFVVTQKRIYRAEFNGVFQYVGSIPNATVAFSDNVRSEFLAEPVPSINWDAPYSGIKGAVSLPNGGIMAWWGNTIAFCEPYYPHAWPISYRLALDFNVVGAAVSAQGIIVCTKGSPYLITGSTPAGMSQNKMDVTAACISAQSIVDMGTYVLYASADGLFAAGGMTSENVTKPFMTAEQWRSIITPSTLKGFKYKDYYLGFYAGGSFAFRPDAGFLFYSETADCGFVDDKTGSLYVKQGAELRKWNEGSQSSYIWKSRLMRVKSGNEFTCAKVDAKNYPVTLKFYTEGSLLATKVIASSNAVRLPCDARYKNCEAEVIGTASIVSIQLATTMSEIV